MSRRQKKIRVAGISKELEEFKAIKAQLDRIEANLDNTHKRTVKHGAIAGALAGSLSGSIVTLGLEYIRIKLGF